MYTVEPEEVAVAIVEYRPVFVTGSVTRPGQQPYRPFMTVRQALSAAGGQMAAPQAAAAVALQSDYVSTWLKLAAQHARTWRLRAELGEEVEFAAPDLPAAPVAPSVLASMLEHERKLRTLRQDDIKRRREHLATAIAQADEQITTLTEQLAKEQEGAEADAAELARATALLGKGAVTYARVLESRRVVLLSSTRALQTGSQLMQVRRTRGEMARQIDEIDDVRGIEVLRDLMDAELVLNTERERLTRIGVQLALAGIEAPRVASTQGPSILVYRRAHDGTRTSMEADMETELAPGDVVDISIPISDSVIESTLPDRSVPVVNAVTTKGAARQ
jgi:polysaccharide export outer membrane protein